MSAQKPYTCAQLAKLGGISRTTLQRWIERGVVRGDDAEDGTPRFGFQDLARVRALASLIIEAPGRRRWLLDAAARGARLRRMAGTVVEVDDDGVWEPQTGQGVLPSLDADSMEGSPGPAPLRAIPLARVIDRRALLAEAAEIESSDPERAVVLYQRLVALGGDTLRDSCVNLGRLQQIRGALDEAVAMYTKAIQCDAQCADAWFNLGLARQDSGDVAGALEAYRRVLDIEPDFADAHFNAATVCEELGDPRAALRHLQAYRRLIT